MKEITLENYMEMQNKRVHYQAMYERHFGSTRKLLIDLFDKAQNLVLDYGCGSEGSLGFKGLYLGPCKNGFTVVTVDRSTSNKFAEFHSIEDMQACCGKWSFDYILYSHVLEHMPFDMSINLLKENSKIARKCVILVPNCGENMFLNQKTFDITHTDEPYNIADFLFLLELNNIKVNRVVLSQVFYGNPMWTFFRTLIAFLVGKSMFNDFVVFCEVN